MVQDCQNCTTRCVGAAVSQHISSESWLGLDTDISQVCLQIPGTVTIIYHQLDTTLGLQKTNVFWVICSSAVDSIKTIHLNRKCSLLFFYLTSFFKIFTWSSLIHSFVKWTVHPQRQKYTIFLLCVDVCPSRFVPKNVFEELVSIVWSTCDIRFLLTPDIFYYFLSI